MGQSCRSKRAQTHVFTGLWGDDFYDLCRWLSPPCLDDRITALRSRSFSGYINNATAFMAGETPHNRSGAVMANMMTANVTGNLLGPLVGGLLAGFAGYRVTFFVCGAMMGIVFC